MEEPASKQPRVLVVDDEPQVRAFLANALTREGLHPIEAASGEDGLAAFEAQAPQLIMIDVQLPRMSGFDVCRAIRAHSSGAEVPIVMMTGNEDAEAVQHAYEAGATDFVTKPFQWLILSHRLQYLLRAAGNLAELRANQELLATAQRIALLGSWEMSFDLDFQGSDALWRILGVPVPAAGDGLRAVREAIHQDDVSTLNDAIRRCRSTENPVRFDHRIVRPDSAVRVMHCQVELGRDAEGTPNRWIGTSQDLTERKRTEEQVRFLSSHDSLTSLGNRQLFQERLELALRHAKQGRWKVGVMYLDLDHFKRINETFSHSVGDSLLSEVANRLVMSVRGADLVARGDRRDDSNSAISRFGGDEFTILIPRLRHERDLAAVARRLLDSLREPFLLEGHEVVVGGSLGITVSPTDGTTAEELLRKADTAMYAAKESGRNQYRFYTGAMNDRTLQRLILEGKLRKAVKNSQFELHYQPKLSLRNGALTGFEGLLRWTDPELGAIGPSEFIPVAEETGLIGPMGNWVIREACQQAAAWSRAGAGPVSIAINLSPEQFRDPGVGDRVAREIEAAGIDPARIELEITESTILHDTDQVIRELEAIRALGMRVSLDDFGTGYSSLSYLRRLPVDTLKIDRAFTQSIETNPEDAALTRGIVDMAKALGLRIVAEGVETEGQRALLAEWKCDEMQGYLYSPAVPPDKAIALWRERNFGEKQTA